MNLIDNLFGIEFYKKLNNEYIFYNYLGAVIKVRGYLMKERIYIFNEDLKVPRWFFMGLLKDHIYLIQDNEKLRCSGFNITIMNNVDDKIIAKIGEREFGFKITQRFPIFPKGSLSISNIENGELSIIKNEFKA